MATIEFYEKPGCVNNTRQKELLRAAGHTVNEHSILEEDWTEEKLMPFFKDRKVCDWFNRAAPRVKSGEINPDQADAKTAIRLMLEEHLFIKRPLMIADGEYVCGFDPEAVDQWIGLTPLKGKEQVADEILSHNLQKCPNMAKGEDCPSPKP